MTAERATRYPWIGRGLSLLMPGLDNPFPVYLGGEAVAPGATARLQPVCMEFIGEEYRIMTAHNIFETIGSRYFQLTNSEKKVANYILAHQMDAQYMSISELAEECEVADATISRFCRRLGLAGYNAFKLELAKASMSTKSLSPILLEHPKGDNREWNQFESICQQRFQESVSTLEQTMKLIDASQMCLAADMICGAGRVLCMGQGCSVVLAQEAWSLFSTISPRFLFVSDSHLQINTLALMEEGDLVLFFSYSGSTKELQDVLAVAHMRNVKVILITRFPKSPGGEHADLLLQCGSNEGPLQAGSATARMAQLFVLDLLFSQVVSRSPEESMRNQERIAEAVARKHL